MRPSLLPPNAFPLERALEAGTAQLGDVDAPIAPLWDPATMPIADLPFLAWALSVDSWDPNWPDAMKRQAVADSIALHRVKGTRLSVDSALARLDGLLHLVEWHEEGGPLQPNTFDVVLPLVTSPGEAPGGDRASAAFAETIIREVTKVKPLREHFQVIQSVALTGGLAVSGTARLFNYGRSAADLDIDPSPAWEFYLQTEDGEPIQSEDSGLLDTAP